MSMNSDRDVQAIRALIERQFASMSWKVEGEPNWGLFTDDFLPDAQLFPSARPLRTQAVPAFIDRMKALVGTTLQSFDETVLGSKIHVFGNVAVAVTVCENIENESNVERVVEMMLLVKEQRRWKIAAQAWDKASESQPIPTDVLGS